MGTAIISCSHCNRPSFVLQRPAMQRPTAWIMDVKTRQLLPFCNKRATQESIQKTDLHEKFMVWDASFHA
jgi:hypothetical protein